MLLTRAPVAGKGIATSPLPLDLHVLGLSLAFILSQDQTLRCIIFFFILLFLHVKVCLSPVQVSVFLFPFVLTWTSPPSGLPERARLFLLVIFCLS